MASGQRRFAVVLLLFFLVASSTTAPITRSLKTVKDQVSVGKFHSQVVTEIEQNDELINLEGPEKERMNLELTDYAGAGASHKHDPKTPGRV